MSLKKILIWSAAIILAANAAAVLNSAQPYSLLAHRARRFNQSAAIRLDTKDCRQRYKGRALCCQCVFEFERRHSETTLKTTGDVKIEPGEITTIHGDDGIITDGHSTIVIQEGHVFANERFLEITRPTFFLIRKDGQVFADPIDAY